MGKFNGADDIYYTKTSIAVTKVKTDKSGRNVKETTNYYPNTAQNKKAAEKAHGKIRYGK